MNHLIFDMAGDPEGERVTSVSSVEGHGIQHSFTAAEPRGRNGLESGHQTGDQGWFEASWKCEDSLASMRNWAKNARINSSGYSPCTLGRGVEETNCLGRHWIESKVVIWRPLQLPDHAPNFGRRMSSSWALDGTLVARFVLGGFMIRSRHERQRHHRFSAHVTNEVFSVR